MANQYDTNLKLQAIADAIGDTQSSGLIQALEDIADAVAGGGGGGSSTAGLVSDNFSDTATYDLGDYCIHNNTLYVCINAITTPGTWDLSDWQATNSGIELSSLNSALDDKQDKLIYDYFDVQFSGTVTTSSILTRTITDVAKSGYSVIAIKTQLTTANANLGFFAETFGSQDEQVIIFCVCSAGSQVNPTCRLNVTYKKN